MRQLIFCRFIKERIMFYKTTINPEGGLKGIFV